MLTAFYIKKIKKMDKGHKQAFHKSTDTKELDHSDSKKPLRFDPMFLCVSVAVGGQPWV